MSSCEPHRCSAYSEDLRWRIVWQTVALEHSNEEVAKDLGVDKSTVSRIVQLFLTTGTVCKKIKSKDSAFRKLTNPAQMLILTLVVEKPGIYLREVQEELSHTLLLDIDTSTIGRFLHSSGFTHQKLCLVALQRDEFHRHKFTVDVSAYETDMLIFLDETGGDRRNAVRKRGYSMRGIPLKKHTLLVRGERVSAIAIMSLSGMIDVSISTGTTNGDEFYTFVEKVLLPNLQPFNGINPHSVVIMDNCSIHHVPETVSMIEEVGAMVHFLPPYSPDLNPIEEAFSKVKSEIKNLEGIMPTYDIETIMTAAFAAISCEDCQGWISHCNILMMDWYSQYTQ